MANSISKLDSTGFISSHRPQQQQQPLPAKPHANQSSSTGFKLVDMINNQRNKITSLDVHHNLNATLKKICRSNTTPPDRLSLDRLKERTMDRRKLTPFESFSIDASTYHDLMAKNQPLPMDMSGLCNGALQASSRNLTNSTLADIQSVHASTCNLVTALRASNQSIIGNARFGPSCNSSSAMNLRYDSLRSHKGRSKRSNSEQLNPSYYHFQNIDGEFGEIDNNNAAFDSVLLPAHSGDNHKLPWKHRQCPSITSSSSSSSTNLASEC